MYIDSKRHVSGIFEAHTYALTGGSGKSTPNPDLAFILEFYPPLYHLGINLPSNPT